MSMLKKLKGIFVEEDGKTSPKAESTANEASVEEVEAIMKSSPKTATTSKSTNTASSTSSVSSGKPEPKFVNVLLKAIESNNQEGFDYLEYKQALQNLANVEMDEQTKFQSALAMAKTMGASSAKLIKSANHYGKILDAEKAKFVQASENQKKKQVTGKEQEIKAHEKAIADKQSQIEKLKKEIAQHQKDLETTKGTINNAAAKVQLTTDKFMTAFQSVRGQIESDIQKMKQYL